jgi:hypothetical protein
VVLAGALLVDVLSCVFTRAMWLALAPYLAVAFVLALAAGAAYEAGAPTWSVYLACIFCGLIVLPGALRWEQRHGDD